MHLLSIVLILLGTLFQTSCLYVYYEAFSRSVSYYQCVRPTVGTQIILQFEYFFYYIKPGMLDNARNATQAGLTPQLIIRPTRCRPVEEELSFLRGAVKEVAIDRYWITFSTEFGHENPCSWYHHTPEENCLYLQKLLSTAEQ